MMKHIRISLVAAAMLLACLPTLSQNRGSQRSSAAQQGYTVSGKVVDADDGTPLEVVNITFENKSFWAVTDLEGKFSLQLRNGEYHYGIRVGGRNDYHL